MDANDTLIVDVPSDEEGDLTEDEPLDGLEPCAILHVPPQKGFAGAEFSLFRGQNKIGRSSEACTICIPDQALSLQHACIDIRKRTEVDLVYDLKSRNGTKRGKMRLEPGVRYELRHGDKLYLADLECQYTRVGKPSAARSKSAVPTGVAASWQKPAGANLDTSAECVSDSDESIDMLHMAEDIIEPQDSPTGLVIDSVTLDTSFSPSGNHHETDSVTEKMRAAGGGLPRQSTLRWQQSTPVHSADREDDIFNVATQAYTMPVDCSVNESCSEASDAVRADDATVPFQHSADLSNGASLGSHNVRTTIGTADPLMPAEGQSETAAQGAGGHQGNLISAGPACTSESDDRGSDNGAYEAETQPYAAVVDSSVAELASKAKAVQPALRWLASESDNESTLLISDVEDNDLQQTADEPAHEDPCDVTISEHCITSELKRASSVAGAEEETSGAGVLGDRASKSSWQDGQQLAASASVTGTPADRVGLDQSTRSPEQGSTSPRQSSSTRGRKRRSCIPLPPQGPRAKRSSRCSTSLAPQPPLMQVLQTGGGAAAGGDYVASSSLEGRGTDDDDEGKDDGDGNVAAAVGPGEGVGFALPALQDGGSCSISSRGDAASVVRAADADTLPYVDDSVDGGCGSRCVTPPAAASDDLTSSPVLPVAAPSTGQLRSDKPGTALQVTAGGEAAPLAAAALTPDASAELPSPSHKGPATVRDDARDTAISSEAPGLPATGIRLPSARAGGQTEGARGARGGRHTKAADAAARDSGSEAANQPAGAAVAVSSGRSGAGRRGRGSAGGAVDAVQGGPPVATAHEPASGRHSSGSGAGDDVPAAKMPRTSFGGQASGRTRAAAVAGAGSKDSGDVNAEAAAQLPVVAAVAAGRSSDLGDSAAGDVPRCDSVDTVGRAAAAAVGRRRRAPANSPAEADRKKGPTKAGAAAAARAAAPASPALGSPGNADDAVPGRRDASAVAATRGRQPRCVTDDATAAARAAAQGDQPKDNAGSSEVTDDVGAAQPPAEEHAVAAGRPSLGRRRPAAAPAAVRPPSLPATEAMAVARGSDESRATDDRTARASRSTPVAAAAAAAAVSRSAAATRRRPRGNDGGDSGAPAAAAQTDPSADESAARLAGSADLLSSPPVPAAGDEAQVGEGLARARRSRPAAAGHKVAVKSPASHRARAAAQGEPASLLLAGGVPVPAASNVPTPSLPQKEEEEAVAKPAGRQSKSQTKPAAVVAAAQVLPTLSPSSAQAVLTLRTSKPKIMFTGITDSDYQEIIKRLGGSLVDSVSLCTHLVTDEVRRTLKFLCCVTRGIPIVTPVWLTESNKASSFLDATQFLLRDKAKEKLYGFSLPITLERARSAPLLKDYRVHATKSVKPPPEQIKDVVTLAGGTYLKALPKPGSFTPNTVIISCPEDASTCKAAAGSGVAVVTAEFLLTGVLQQRLDVNAYALSC